MSSQPEEPKSSFAEGFMQLCLMCGAVAWLIGSGGFAKIGRFVENFEVDSFLRQLGLHGKSFAEYDCKELSQTIKGAKLSNMFGVEWEILLVKKYAQVSKSAAELRCRGLAATSRGELRVVFKLEDVGDGNLIYQVQHDP